MNSLVVRTCWTCVVLWSVGCAGTPETRVAPPTSHQVAPFLLFQDGRAEEAMGFYADTFRDGRVISVERYGTDGLGPEGSLFLGEFEIGGQTLRCTDSAIRHEFSFTPAISLFVDCPDELELERMVTALSEGGLAMMPLGDYGFSQKFAWIQDRYGVSWQLNLPHAE